MVRKVYARWVENRKVQEKEGEKKSKRGSQQGEEEMVETEEEGHIRKMTGINGLQEGIQGFKYRDKEKTTIDGELIEDWEVELARKAEIKLLYCHEGHPCVEPISRHDLPAHAQVLSCTWTKVKKKLDGSLSTRYVPRGFEQEEVQEDCSSPTKRQFSIRMALNRALMLNQKMATADVTRAFLYALMQDDQVFIEAPQEAGLGVGCILKVMVWLYGLKGAPQAWYNTIKEHLQKLGFSQLKCDGCVFMKGSTLIVLHVDDLMITAEEKELDKLEEDISKRFKIKWNGGTKHRFCGQDIKLTKESTLR